MPVVVIPPCATIGPTLGTLLLRRRRGRVGLHSRMAICMIHKQVSGTVRLQNPLAVVVVGAGDPHVALEEDVWLIDSAMRHRLPPCRHSLLRETRTAVGRSDVVPGVDEGVSVDGDGEDSSSKLVVLVRADGRSNTNPANRFHRLPPTCLHDRVTCLPHRHISLVSPVKRVHRMSNLSLSSSLRCSRLHRGTTQ